MNDTFNQYTAIGGQHWRSLSFVSKVAAVLICAILMFSGLIMGVFIFSASLAIALAVYLHSLFCPNKSEINHDFAEPM